MPSETKRSRTASSLRPPTDVAATSYLAAMAPNNPLTPDDDAPPVLGSWRSVYAFVLALHVVVLLLFYAFSKLYA